MGHSDFKIQSFQIVRLPTSQRLNLSAKPHPLIFVNEILWVCRLWLTYWYLQHQRRFPWQTEWERGQIIYSLIHWLRPLACHSLHSFRLDCQLSFLDTSFPLNLISDLSYFLLNHSLCIIELFAMYMTLLCVLSIWKCIHDTFVCIVNIEVYPFTVYFYQINAWF